MVSVLSNHNISVLIRKLLFLFSLQKINQVCSVMWVLDAVVLIFIAEDLPSLLCYVGFRCGCF